MEQPNEQEDPPYLDNEERDIIETFYRGEFQSVKNFPERKPNLNGWHKKT